eukprot:1858415-Rhodomonas_salina.2
MIEIDTHPWCDLAFWQHSPCPVVIFIQHNISINHYNHRHQREEQQRYQPLPPSPCLAPPNPTVRKPCPVIRGPLASAPDDSAGAHSAERQRQRSARSRTQTSPAVPACAPGVSVRRVQPWAAV